MGEGHHPYPSVSHPSSVLGLWDVPASAPFKTSPRGHQVTLGRDWQEADLHEGPAPTHGSGRHQKARGPHHPAQEAEEAASQECPHTMAWTVLLIGLLAVGSGQGPGLCILEGHLPAALRTLTPWQSLSLSCHFRGGFSDCDPGAGDVSVSWRDRHTHLCL